MKCVANSFTLSCSVMRVDETMQKKLYAKCFSMIYTLKSFLAVFRMAGSVGKRFAKVSELDGF